MVVLGARTCHESMVAFFGAMIPLGSLEAGALAHRLDTPVALAIGAIICAAGAVTVRIVIACRERAAAK